MSVCSLSQPFLIHSAIGIIREENASRTDKIGLVLATVLVYGGKAILQSVYTSLLDRTSTRTRGVLTGKICAKAFRLPSKEASKGAAITLSTTDIDAIIQGIRYIHELWISFVEIGFIMYFLWIFAGYCCFLLFIPTILTVLWTTFFGPRVGAALRAWNAKIQERVGKTTQILAQAKQVKLLGLQSTLSDYIQQLRTIELRFQRSYMNHQSGIVVMAMSTMNLTPVLIIAGTLFITHIPLPLDANRIFAILAVVQLSFAPLRYMVEAYARMSSLSSCFDRIAEFVKQEEQSDGRTHILPIRSSVPVELALDVTNDSFLSRPIDVQGADVGYEGSPTPVLYQVDVMVPKGFLAIANGPNGSGKTAFLHSLAGEAKVYKGQVYVAEGPVAYCEQTPWLRNGSIQDNVLGYLPFNQQWYHTVLKACCLEEDLQQMPKGDKTLASNQGSKLSGGQRHRIALARAIYSRSPVLVLDDVFSALDNSTAGRIFAGLFSQDGLLRQLGTTVVLATHRVEFFKAADLQLEFSEGGVIMKNGERSDIHSDVQLVATQSQEPVDKEAIQFTVADEALDAINKQRSVYHKSDFSIYKFFFSTGSKSLFLLFAVLSAVTTAGERIPGIFMRYWLDQKPYDRTQFAGYAALSTSAVLGFLGMAAVFFHNLVPQYGQNMHRMLVDSMLGATIQYLTSADHGVLINRISQHMTLVTQQFARDFFKLPYSFLNVVADVAIIASASYYTAIFVPIIFGILNLVQLVYLRTSRQLRGLDLEAKTPMYSLLAEVGSGASHMRAFSWEDAYLQRVNEVLDMSQKPFYAMACVQRWLTLIMDSINACVAVVLMCLAVFGGSVTSQSGLGLAFVTLMGLSEAISFAMAQWIAIETSLGSIAGIRSFVAEAPVEKNSQNLASLPDSWPQSGTIEFKDVTAFYGNAETSTAALKDISVTIAAKEKAAIKGRTGSGKSSLFLTLLSCLSYQGSIQIDGQELRDIPLDILRTRIALCPQENLKLPGTIRQNLMPWLLNDPSKGFDDSELEKILTGLDLWEIVTAAGNLDAPMEELDLSSGQSQLFSVARTMITKTYRGSRIILMDEVTSNLDPKTEDMIAKAIDVAFSDCTVLTIAHRQRTITDADKVYEMENGSMKLTTG